MEKVFDLSIASDVIRGRNNFGSNKELSNISENDVINLVKDYINKFGKPQNHAGMLIWQKDGNTYSISAYKKGLPFDPMTII